MSIKSSSNLPRRRTFRPMLGLVSWWKGRNYYFATEDFACEERSIRTRKEGNGEPAPSQLSIDYMVVTQDGLQQQPRNRLRKFNPRKDSMKRKDAVSSSFWELGDEISQITTPVSNTGYKPEFMVEHLGSQSGKVQPHEVEIVLRM